MSQSNNDILLAISTPPFWHFGRTIRKNSLHTLVALAPAAILALVHWGVPAMRVMALSVFVAMLTEALCQTLMKQKLSQNNGTAAVTGLVLSFLLPASAPWWLVVIGAAAAIGIGRMAFGGYGANQVSAALVGWALIFVSFPVQMDPSASLLGSTLVDPLFRAKFFGGAAVADFSLLDLLAGNQITAIRQRHIHQCRRPMAQCRRAPRCSGRRRSPQNCWGNPTSHRDRQRIAPHHIGSRLLEPRRAYSLAGVIYPHHAEIALAQGHRDDGQPAAVRHQRWMQGPQ